MHLPTHSPTSVFQFNATKRIQCVFEPYDTCPAPLVCFEVHNATGSLIGSHCGCVDYYAFLPPSCTTPSSLTFGPIMVFSINSFFVFLAFLYGVFGLAYYLVFPRYYFQDNKLNTVLIGGVCTLIGQSLLVCQDLLSLAEIIHPSRVVFSPHGIRVTYLFSQRAIIYSIANLALSCGFLLIIPVLIYEYLYHLYEVIPSEMLLLLVRTMVFSFIGIWFFGGLLAIALGYFQLFFAVCAGIFGVGWVCIVYSVFKITYIARYPREHHSKNYITLLKNTRRRMMPFFLGLGFLTSGLGLLATLPNLETAAFIKSFTGTTFALLGFLPTGVGLLTFAMASVSSPMITRIGRLLSYLMKCVFPGRDSQTQVSNDLPIAEEVRVANNQDEFPQDDENFEVENSLRN